MKENTLDTAVGASLTIRSRGFFGPPFPHSLKSFFVVLPFFVQVSVSMTNDVVFLFLAVFFFLLGALVRFLPCEPSFFAFVYVLVVLLLLLWGLIRETKAQRCSHHYADFQLLFYVSLARELGGRAAAYRTLP